MLVAMVEAGAGRVQGLRLHGRFVAVEGGWEVGWLGGCMG